MFYCQAIEPITKARIPRSQKNALLVIADRLEPRLRKRFLEAMEKLRDQIKIKQLAAAVARNNMQEIYEALGLNNMNAALGALTDGINEGAAAAGVITAQQAAAGSAGRKIVARFDVMNPQIAQYLANYNLSLITRITDEHRQVVRTVLNDVFRTPTDPTTGARALRRFMVDTLEGRAEYAGRRIKEVFGLDPRRAQALLNYRRLLEDGDRTAMNRAIGGNAERVINAAIRDNTMTPDKIERLVDGYRTRLLQQRAGAISHTESMRAANMGSRAAWEQVFDQNPGSRQAARRYWVATNDERTRESHIGIADLNSGGVGVDEPFKLPGGGTIMYPHDPNADPAETINCRCVVIVEFTDVDQSRLAPLNPGRGYLGGGRNA